MQCSLSDKSAMEKSQPNEYKDTAKQTYNDENISEAKCGINQLQQIKLSSNIKHNTINNDFFAPCKNWKRIEWEKNAVEHKSEN